MIAEYITDFCIWVVKKVNKYKNRCLAQKLFDLSKWYEPRP